MRTKRDTQSWFDFQPSNLKLTNDYYARYEAISEILDGTPRLLELVHRDLEAALEEENHEGRKRGGFVYTSEMVLRLALCQILVSQEFASNRRNERIFYFGVRIPQ